MTSVAACRFMSSVAGSWTIVKATYVSSTALTCVAPASSAVSADSYGYVELQVSLSGCSPGSGAAGTCTYSASMLWSSDSVYFLYYRVPSLAMSPATVSLTGEDASSVAVSLTLTGGPFFDTSSFSLLKCRFSGTFSTLGTYPVSASFVDALNILCPVCATTSISGSTRCLNGAIATAHTNFTVEVTLNGVDFHTLATPLVVSGAPTGLKVSAVSATARFTYAATAAASLTIDAITAQLIDSSGYPCITIKKLYLIATVTVPTNAGAQTLTMSYPASLTTSSLFVNGVVSSATPVFSSAPKVGVYVINFFVSVANSLTAIDATLTSASLSMTITVRELEGIDMTCPSDIVGSISHGGNIW